MEIFTRGIQIPALKGLLLGGEDALMSLSEHWPPYSASPISEAVHLAVASGEIKLRTIERDLGETKKGGDSK